jgi:MOSC domain-containing protein YiiM
LIDVGSVIHLAVDGQHRFSKAARQTVKLISGIGITGDAHAGITVQHLSRKRQDPDAPNLRQVHLIHSELLDELRQAGFSVQPGELGENLTTRDVALLELSRGTRLLVGESVELEITGLRNPCAQIDAFQPGLLKTVLWRADDGSVIRKTGVMAIVVNGGTLTVGDSITVVSPAKFVPLQPV